MNKTKILIVEDEPIVALDIKNTLKKLGYVLVETASNYNDSLLSINKNEPDIIFMDIHLNNSKSGIVIAQQINKNKDIAIVYLTASSDGETMKQAIKTNPVSYIVKPFKRDEIKSSVMISIYKINNNVSKLDVSEYRSIGFDYYYDLKNDNLFYKDQPIHISVNEKLFLKLLISANGKIVPFSRIEEYIWRNTNLSNGAFRTLVYRLRSKLEFKLIENVPSFGYKLYQK